MNFLNSVVSTVLSTHPLLLGPSATDYVPIVGKAEQTVLIQRLGYEKKRQLKSETSTRIPPFVRVRV